MKKFEVMFPVEVREVDSSDAPQVHKFVVTVVAHSANEAAYAVGQALSLALGTKKD
jgi:hypothetical protein